MPATICATLMLAAVTVQDPGTWTSQRHLETLDVTIVDERRLDSANARIVRTTRVGSEPVDADAMRHEEARRRDEASGKLWSDLPARLGKGQKTPVVFWLRRPAGMPDLRVHIDAAVAGGTSGENARRSAMDVARAFVRARTGPFSRALRERGGTTDYVDEIVPLVFATLGAADVRALAARDDVDQVFYACPKWLDEGKAVPDEWASPSARTDYVHRQGITGAGVKVLVNDTASVATTNPYLPPIVTGNPQIPVNQHPTFVAGCLASIHPVHHGAAPGLAQIYDYAGWGDVFAPQAWSWGMTQGISIGNSSWWTGQFGNIEFLDRYFDYIIRNFAVMMFKSAGNLGNGSQTTTPGNGFNMTTTGSANDLDSHDWEDDLMATSSSTGDPSSGNSKPEVVAHGEAVTSTSDMGPTWLTSASGTSFASPISCGVAALLQQEDPSLTTQPEVVKAMLMAGAWNNISGGETLSDEDGAGAIDAAASWRAVHEGQFHQTTLTPSSFPGGFYSHSMQLDQGDETRVVALWFSTADSSFATDSLLMDLDLVVLDPSGSVVASAASATDPFEVVQFIPAQSGTYTVRMQNQSFQGTSEPFAIAWTTRQDAATDEVQAVGDGSIGSTIQINWLDPYHPGEIYVGLFSLTPYPAVTPIGANRILPFGFDGLSQATFAGPSGFIGTLDASGAASMSFAVPPIAPLTIHAGMFTFKDNPGRAVETSPATTFTIGQ